MPFTKHAVEIFISDKITKVTECNVSNLYAEFPSAKDWISGFGLMVIFVNQPQAEMRPLALQFLRRVEMGLAEYSRAREELQDLVFGSRGRWSPYFRALYHFEAAISQIYQAYDYSRKALNTRYFDSNDGSPLDRLNRIYNISKHELAAQDQPVWISNRGIETAKVQITFSEIETLLRSFGRIAMKLTSTLEEKRSS